MNIEFYSPTPNYCQMHKSKMTGISADIFLVLNIVLYMQTIMMDHNSEQRSRSFSPQIESIMIFVQHCNLP